jgi:hypothetical protein
VTQQQMRGEAKINVGSADVSGVSIALLSPRTVLGVMRSVGCRADAIQHLNPCNVNLSRDGPLVAGATYVPKWQQDGRFTLAQWDGGFTLDRVLPGEYQAKFLCFGELTITATSSSGHQELFKN